MFLTPVKILKPTLVVVFLVLATGSPAAFAQQQNRGTLRIEVPHVTLSASPNSVMPGRQVRLVARLSSGYPNIRFRFDFGDGTQSGWQTSTIAAHTYRVAGNYLPFVDIGTATSGGVTRLGGSPRARLQVIQISPGPVGPYVSRTTIGTAPPVTSNPRSSNNRSHRVRSRGSTDRKAIASARGRDSYRKSPERAAIKASPPRTDSSPSRPNITATSPTPGSSSPAAASSPVPSASFDSYDTAVTFREGEGGGSWWNYLLLALPLALVALVLGKKYLAPRPTIRTFADPGTANVTDPSGLVVDSRVDRRPNVLHGEHIVSPDDAGLVKSVRREDV